VSSHELVENYTVTQPDWQLILKLS